MIVFVFFLLLLNDEGIRSSSTKQKLLLFGSEKKSIVSWGFTLSLVLTGLSVHMCDSGFVSLIVGPDAHCFPRADRQTITSARLISSLSPSRAPALPATRSDTPPYPPAFPTTGGELFQTSARNARAAAPSLASFPVTSACAHLISR
jgi:hypothetical protein